MEIGELKHRITLKKLSIIVDDNGFEKEELINYKYVWAKILNLSGKEYYEAAKINKENTVKFIIRFIAGIDESMVIGFKESNFNIISINNIKYENKYIEIKAIEVQSSG